MPREIKFRISSFKFYTGGINPANPSISPDSGKLEALRRSRGAIEGVAWT